jgi:hypothetical protein
LKSIGMPAHCDERLYHFIVRRDFVNCSHVHLLSPRSFKPFTSPYSYRTNREHLVTAQGIPTQKLSPK